jgi:hypothetical protein
VNDRLLQALSGSHFPVYIDPDGRPCLRPQQGPHRHRVLLTSLPKAGTYLFGEVIRNLGFVDTGIHIEGDGGQQFVDYRFLRTHEAAQTPHLQPHTAPLETTLGLIRPGQYVVSHLETRDARMAIRMGFKVAFAYRNLRDCLVTFVLYLLRTGPRNNRVLENLRAIGCKRRRMQHVVQTFGTQWLGGISNQIDLLDDPAVLKLKFEEMANRDDPERQAESTDRLACFLDIDLSRDERMGICRRSLDARTLTKSAQRTNIDDHWDAAVEREFERLGGTALNLRLGFE